MQKQEMCLNYCNQPCKHYFSESQLPRILINSHDECRHCVETNSESHKILQRKPKDSMMEHGLLKDNIDHSLKNPNKQTALGLDTVGEVGV